ncbi:MAG TPA: hypothetical protein VKA36_02045 [Solirubrobacterales bacterium]|nr:hypothetical protein [Solirubrobacterales bacterium]
MPDAPDDFAGSPPKPSQAENREVPGVATRLDVYGLTIEIDGDSPELVDRIWRDYAWFAAPSPGLAPVDQADVTVRVERGEPDYDSLGSLQASFTTPRNAVYEDGARRIVDYSGRALLIRDAAARSAVIRGTDEHLVHEAGYQFLLSRIGQHVEQRWLPRLHALAFSGPAGAVAVMLPSGGGKSRLALRAIEDDAVGLLSEDSPLVDRRGRLHPFPLRVGLNPGDEDGLPADRIRRLERMEFPPKLLLDVDHFADRIERTPQPARHIVVGRRSLSRGPRLEEVPRRTAVPVLFREAVVGVGLYQGMEFVLQRGTRDVLGQMRPAAIRALCCAAALARTRVWSLDCGRDGERNWEAVRSLLDR